MEKQQLIEKFEKVIIPSIEKMIKREQLHIQSLEFYNKKFSFLLKIDNTDFLKIAKLNLKHLRFRLKQYKKYVKNLKSEIDGVQ